MSSIEKIDTMFDAGKAAFRRVSEENNQLRAQIETERMATVRAEERCRQKDNVIESMKMLAQADARRITELEEQRDKLIRTNAILMTTHDTVAQMLKSDGAKVADSSNMRPEQLMKPRRVADDEQDPEIVSELENKLAALLPAVKESRGYVEQLEKQDRPPMLQSVVDDIAKSPEAEHAEQPR